MHKVGGGEKLHKQSSKQTTMELMLNRDFAAGGGGAVYFELTHTLLIQLLAIGLGFESLALTHENLIFA